MSTSPLRTETHCIYTFERGNKKGLRCSCNIVRNGYCGTHSFKADGKTFSESCLGMLFRSFDDWHRPNQGTWYQCKMPAGVSGYCQSCFSEPVNQKELENRCCYIYSNNKRCSRNVEQDGYCLHCIYNNLNKDLKQTLITDYFRVNKSRKVNAVWEHFKSGTWETKLGVQWFSPASEDSTTSEGSVDDD